MCTHKDIIISINGTLFRFLVLRSTIISSIFSSSSNAEEQSLSINVVHTRLRNRQQHTRDTVRSEEVGSNYYKLTRRRNICFPFRFTLIFFSFRTFNWFMERTPTATHSHKTFQEINKDGTHRRHYTDKLT